MLTGIVVQFLKNNNNLPIAMLGWMNNVINVWIYVLNMCNILDP